jgi:hypothetical protein
MVDNEGWNLSTGDRYNDPMYGKTPPSVITTDYMGSLGRRAGVTTNQYGRFDATNTLGPAATATGREISSFYTNNPVSIRADPNPLALSNTIPDMIRDLGTGYTNDVKSQVTNTLNAITSAAQANGGVVPPALVDRMLKTGGTIRNGMGSDDPAVRGLYRRLGNSFDYEFDQQAAPDAVAKYNDDKGRYRDLSAIANVAQNNAGFVPPSALVREVVRSPFYDSRFADPPILDIARAGQEYVEGKPAAKPSYIPSAGSLKTAIGHGATVAGLGYAGAEHLFSNLPEAGYIGAAIGIPAMFANALAKYVGRQAMSGYQGPPPPTTRQAMVRALLNPQYMTPALTQPPLPFTSFDQPQPQQGGPQVPH